MIARPTWERPLRRRLAKTLDRRGITHGWIRENAALLTIWLIVLAVLMTAGEHKLGPAGGSTGIATASGVAGVFLAFCLRSRWRDQAWLTEWTPACHAVARRIQTREILGLLSPLAISVFATSAGMAGLSAATGMVEALGAASLAMATGFLLCGGRFSERILWASGIWSAACGILSPWLLDDRSDFPQRIVDSAAAGWLPVQPWSLIHHASRTGMLQGLLLAAALAISLRDWRRSWQDRSCVPAALAFRELVVPEEPPGALEDAVTVEDPGEPDEEQRAMIRKQVAFHWFGLAGYLPDRPMPRLDRWIWRWLTPRQRLISTLGSHDAFGWFARTRWSILSLGGLAALSALPRLAMRQADFGAVFDEHAFWLPVAMIALFSVAVMFGWPASRSRFQPWLDLMDAPGIGRFPAMAMLPVCPSEWMRAAAKEWTARALWISIFWTIPVLAWLPLLPAEGPIIFTLPAAPFLLHAGLFPLSAMHRLIRPVAGSVFSIHGITRTVPAFAAGLACATATLAAVVAMAAGLTTTGPAMLLVAATFGWFGLQLILDRCRNRCFDLRPVRQG